jgi:hypothetical protein
MTDTRCCRSVTGCADKRRGGRTDRCRSACAHSVASIQHRCRRVEPPRGSNALEAQRGRCILLVGERGAGRVLLSGEREPDGATARAVLFLSVDVSGLHYRGDGGEQTHDGRGRGHVEGDGLRCLRCRRREHGRLLEVGSGGAATDVGGGTTENVAGLEGRWLLRRRLDLIRRDGQSRVDADDLVGGDSQNGLDGAASVNLRNRLVSISATEGEEAEPTLARMRSAERQARVSRPV